MVITDCTQSVKNKGAYLSFLQTIESASDRDSVFKLTQGKLRELEFKFVLSN